MDGATNPNNKDKNKTDAYDSTGIHVLSQLFFLTQQLLTLFVTLQYRTAIP